MNEIQAMIREFEGNKVEIVNINGQLLFELYSTGMALGYINKAKGNVYPHKTRIDKIVQNVEISTVVHGVQRYLTEDQLYDFMLESRTKKCRYFRKWVVTEVLPTIRKNDYYVDKNISDENYNKLVKELEQKSVWLRKCFGNTVVSINKVARDLNLSVDEIMTYMKKNKWINSKGEITEVGGLGKVLLKNNKYYLGKRGMSLICNAKSRQQNKLKVENSINKNGLNDIL